MKNLIWLNDYNLSFDYKNSEKIFIFSKEYLELISAQRLRIIYQELCKRKVRIFKGEYFQTIKQIAIEENFNKVIIPNCPDSKILKTFSTLKKEFDVELFQSNAVMFSNIKSNSFFRFWNLIKNNIISKD